MDDRAPVIADAFRLLRRDLCEHLDEAEALATERDTWSEEDEAAARDLISDLVTVIRGMLAQHRDRDSGPCTACAVPAPCSVVTTIHRLVKDQERQFSVLLKQSHENR
jgi:hypothetical protein